jgi:hypothetical protein
MELSAATEAREVVMTATVIPDLAPLVGSWRLVSNALTFTDNGERLEPYGSNPTGRLLIERGGRMMGMLMKSNRQPPKADAERVTLFNEMLAYTGSVRITGPGQFIITVDFAWHPEWGGAQQRFFTIDGDRLSIRTPEQTVPRFPGRLRVSELVFMREHPIL